MDFDVDFVDESSEGEEVGVGRGLKVSVGWLELVLVTVSSDDFEGLVV